MSRTFAFLLCVFFTAAACAQGYPARPITMIVPFPPGGVADIVGRPLALTMEKTLKQPVVVQNRTGAGGALGMREAARAAPDGYTVLMALSSISIFPVSERVNGKQPSYELKDFAPIALVTADPTVLVVRSDSRYHTVKDFVDAAKANPGKINYSSSGVYGTLHVAMEIFANAAGIHLFHVPYDLRRVDPGVWVSGEKGAWVVAEELDRVQHFKLMNGRHLRLVAPRDPFERRASALSQYRTPRVLVEKWKQLRAKRKRAAKRKAASATFPTSSLPPFRSSPPRPQGGARRAPSTSRTRARRDS